MSSPIAQFKVNDEVEGLRILAELGQGAASTVYLAQDPKTKQIYSVKHVQRLDAKDDRFLQQAVYEHEVASKLDHPNIRRIHRVIKRKKGFFSLSDVFLIMEMLDGVSMDRKPPTNLDDALTLFIQTAEALKHMHSRGYVHADMKPNNVLIERGPVAKIIDLGQSCKAGTVKPRIQGTPDYIAPEQVHRQPITERTDIYNLGATMYWTLTARNIPTALAKGDSLVSRLDAHLVPKATPVIELNANIPPKLSELIMQCVEPEPDQRPANMGLVVDRLQMIQALLRAKNNESGAGMANGKSRGGSGLGMPAAVPSQPEPTRDLGESGLD
jgi:serine/threonine-protein kinase